VTATSAKGSSVFGPEAVWIGVYDALSAVIASGVSANALWLSGNCVSASLRACPDASIITATEMLNVAQNVCVAVPGTPLIVDCDAGYGDSMAFSHYVAQYCINSGVRGLCVEDKISPKRNSFYRAAQLLVPTDEMVDKLKKAHAVRRTHRESLMLVARCESLVAGQADQVLPRLEAYAATGADAVMLQARAHQEADYARVAARWKQIGSCPLICSPTAFPHLSPRDLWDMGFDAVIHANHLARAAVKAMQTALPALMLRKGNQLELEQQMVSLDLLAGVMREQSQLEGLRAEPGDHAGGGRNA
jgi:phosphoenolpyruvate phosphomutase